MVQIQLKKLLQKMEFEWKENAYNDLLISF